VESSNAQGERGCRRRNDDWEHRRRERFRGQWRRPVRSDVGLVGSVPFGIGWAQVGNIAFEVGLAFVPFAGAIRSAANGDIKGAVLEGLFDLATMGTGGPLKAAVQGAAALADAARGAKAAKGARGGTRTANRLPDGKNGRLGAPNGAMTKSHPHGDGQVLTHDANGKPVRDIDWGHGGPMHGGVPDPHLHDRNIPSPEAPNPVRSDGYDPGDFHGPGF
jgi:hypothetical protein